MSSYTAELTLPINGTISNQTTTTLKVHQGVIHKIDLLFPSGCVGLCHFGLFLGGHPLAPSTEGTYFVADAETISFNEYIDLEKEINILTLKGYNTDVKEAHTIYFRVFILPKEVLIPSFSRQLLFLAIQELMLKSEGPQEVAVQV